MPVERAQGRADHDPRGAGPQPPGGGLRPAAPPVDGHHRPVGIRQEQPRLRHALCRGPAPLRREPLALRAAVPGADGEAGGGVGDRPVARHRHRPAHQHQPPPLDRGHRDGGLRPPAGPLLGAGPAALPALRAGDRRPDARADGGPALRPGPGRPDRGAGPGRARAQGRVPPRARRAGPARLRARAGGRPGLRDLRQPPTLDPRRNHRIEVLVERLVLRDGAQKRLVQALDKALHLADGVALVLQEGGARAAAQPAPGLRRLRRLGARAVAARVLLQQPLRRLLRLRRPGRALGRWTPSARCMPDEEPLAPGRGDPSLAAPRTAPGPRGAAGRGRAPRLLAGRAGARAVQEGAPGPAARRRRRLRGRAAQPRAARRRRAAAGRRRGRGAGPRSGARRSRSCGPT